MVRVSELRLLIGDVRERLLGLKAESVHCCVTSPPFFGLRRYETPPQTWVDGWIGELGTESTVSSYVTHLVEVFCEVRRVLRPSGLLFVNLGDSYASAWPCRRRSVIGQGSLEDGRRANRPPRLGDGLKEKNLMLVPARFAIAMVDDGWWLRSDVIWHKPACKPESVTDRFTMDYEHVLMFAKSPRYFFDADAVREPHKTSLRDQARQHNTRGKQAYAAASAGGFRGNAQQDAYAGLGFGAGGRNRRSVWSINPKPYKGAHFACFPEELVEIMLKAGASQGGTCSKCGSPRVRVTIKGAPDLAWQAACGGSAVDGTYNGQATKDYAAAGAENASAVKARILEGMRPKHTVGFAFTCSCWGAPTRTKFPRARREGKRHQREISGDHQRRVERHLTALEGTTVPCRVLDCFGGSGTTAAVAHRLGLDCTLIELQADYAQLAVERVAKAGGVLEVVGLDPPAIRDLLAAAAERPTLPREVEWEEPDGAIDEADSGWPDDVQIPNFRWADKS